MKDDTETSTFALLASDRAFDPLEDGVRQRVRDFIEAILEEELGAALGRGRYERPAEGARGQRNGHRERQVIGTFGAETVKVPRARMIDDAGQATRMALEGAASLSASDEEGGGADRGGLPRRDQHAAGEARAVRPVRRSGEQGRGQPGLAQGEDRLGGMVRAQPCRAKTSFG